MKILGLLPNKREEKEIRRVIENITLLDNYTELFEKLKSDYFNILLLWTDEIKEELLLELIFRAKEINKELLITVLLSAMGNASGNLLIVHGQKIMAKRVGARVLQTLIKLLGGKITQQIAKSMAAKWIPIAGAIAMAAWSKYTTNKIGQKAKEVFSKEIVFENSEINESNIIDIVDEKINLKSIQKTKVQILINLIKIDNNIDSSEIKFIEDFMDKIELDIDDKMDLIQQLNSQNKISADYNILKNNNEEILYLLIDLVALAKIDNEFHITEKLFIKEIAKILEFNQEELQLLMES